MARIELDTASVRVMLAIPICYDIAFQTFLSCLATQETCIRNGIDLRITPIVGVRYVPAARSQAVAAFLKSDATHLFFIDSDMSWQAGDFVRFVALATKMECLCGAYPFRREPLQFMINMSEEFAGGQAVQANEWGCVPFRGSGMGFTILQRGLLERLAENAPKLRFPGSDEPVACLFETDSVDGQFRGEDMNFFAKVESLGIKVWVDPSVKLGHVGEKEFTGRLADHLRFGSPA